MVVTLMYCNVKRMKNVNDIKIIRNPKLGRFPEDTIPYLCFEIIVQTYRITHSSIFCQSPVVPLERIEYMITSDIRSRNFAGKSFIK